jgi:hypothetical protein
MQNYTSVHSYFKGNVKLHDLVYITYVSDTGIPQYKINWCEKNCIKKWGWFFNDIKSYIGFECEQEYFLYILSNE